MNARRSFFLLGSLAACSVATAQFTFQSANYSAGVEPSGVGIGDYNGDGFNDIATTVDAPDRVLLFFNNGDGTFVNGGSANLPNSSSPEDVVAGDVNGDGTIDLAVSLKDFNQVLILLNQGGGVFNTGASSPTGIEPRGMDIGDHDGDGDLDICVANRESNNATVMTNHGNGTFAAVTLATGAEPRDASFGDYDGDGDLDMSVTTHDDRSISVFTNNGGVFTRTNTLRMSSVRPEGGNSADLNGDGLDDIAAATNAPDFATVYLATGGGQFSGPFNYPTGGIDSSTIDAADMDCDGVLDLATGNESSNNVSVLGGTGGGAFGGPTLFGAGANPEDITAGDLDNDGVADLVVANRNSGNITVFINETCDGGGGQFSLALSGVCPGLMTATASDATPGGQVAFIRAFGTGSQEIPPGNPCAGTTLGLNSSATLVQVVTADASGAASISGNVPAAGCRRVFLQALDIATCTTSDVEAL